MDMAEEGQNQPKISPKPMEFKEMVEFGEEDRISGLPDCLLIEIMSRLPSIEDAIRTGSLSKRWKHLWTWVNLYTSVHAFTHLTLEGCVLNPTRAIRWKNLRSLSICDVKLDEDLIKSILCGSPLLETSVLKDCCGYRRLDITSKSVKNFVLSGYSGDGNDDLDEVFVINAPNILSLTIEDELFLLKLLVVNVSSLDYTISRHGDTTHDEETEEEILKGFIINLRHVKELKIGVSCAKVVSRLQTKGFIFPQNMKFPAVY